jgi:coatomer protein complex subunit alpha (xenin)
MMVMGGVESGGFQMPPSGRPAAACWATNSSHAADHLAAGSASSAMALLNRQIAASNFEVLKRNMTGYYLGSTGSMPGIPGSTSMALPFVRNDAAGPPGNESLPRVFIKTSDLNQAVRMGYRYFQTGKFNDARACFLSILHKIPLCVVNNRAEANEVKEMLDVSREYVTALRIKAALSEVSGPARSTELSAYFTHCNLQPSHLLLALRSAMGTAFKHKNFIVAASFARRLLELPDMTSERNAELRVKVSKVLQKSEQMARNEHELKYNDAMSFVLDCATFSPIYSNEGSVKCSYCGSAYKEGTDMEHKVCLTCTMCKVGENTIGLVTGV